MKIFACCVAVLAMLFFPLQTRAAALTVSYEFVASDFGEGLFDGTPSPVDSVEGSFGFTFEPNSGNLEISPDFVRLTILGVEYDISNTAVSITDRDVNAIQFGNPINGINVVSRFSDDFVLTFFTVDSGEVYLPGTLGSFLLSNQELSDSWVTTNVVVTMVPSAEVLLWQLINIVVGVGPGKSLEDKLLRAQAFLESGDQVALCDELTGFLNQVEAQAGKQISFDFAFRLAEHANTVSDSVGCD